MGFWLSDGTVSLVSNSKTVTGTGTAFKSGANPARVGQSLIVYVGGNTAIYEIERVDSDSSMQIAMPWRGATINNAPYAINTASEGSPSDLSRRAAQVMGYYQGQLDVIQELLSGSGDVVATLPDGTVINLPSWLSFENKISTKQDKSVTLDVISKVSAAENKLPYFNGPSSAATTDITDFGRKLVASRDAESTRKTLSLGEASTRMVGFGRHQLIEAAGSVAYVSSLDNFTENNLFGATQANWWNGGVEVPSVAINVPFSATWSAQLIVASDSNLWVRRFGNSELGYSYMALTTKNSVKDANGFWKGASPVMRLHGNDADDSLAYLYRDEGWIKSGCSVVNREAAGAEAARLGVGHYRVTGCRGFAREGWYIETPNDANGNKIMFVRYQQHDDGEIEIWTSSPDYSSGRSTEGDPVDIPAGRWIDLRLCMDDRDISLAS